MGSVAHDRFSSLLRLFSTAYIGYRGRLNRRRVCARWNPRLCGSRAGDPAVARLLTNPPRRKMYEEIDNNRRRIDKMIGAI